MSSPSAWQIDPSNPPLAINPSGALPNFDNPPSLAGAVFAIGLTLSIISAIFVVIRLVTNYRAVGRLGLADYLCLFAFMLMTFYYGVLASLSQTARHAWDIPFSFITVSYLKTTAIEKLITGPTLWSSKASILALYLQLFGSKYWLRWASYSALIITFLVFWVNIPLTGVYCIPHTGASWNTQLLTSCAKLAVMHPIYGAVGLAADLLILVLPFPIVYRLDLTTRKKAGLAAVFLTGLLAIVSSAVSLYYRVRLYTGVDPTWNAANIAITTLAEGYITIIVSCAPALSTFWTNTFKESTFYTQLCSLGPSLLCSRTSHARTEKEGKSTKHLGQHSLRPGSYLRGNQRYHELYDAAYSRPTTEISTSRNKILGKAGVIIKSTTIDQLSEHSAV